MNCKRIAALAMAVGAMTASANAQCFSGPDGLSGPCWQPTTANLPGFQDVVLPGTGICWDNCAPTQRPIRVVVPTPTQTSCDTYSTTVTIVDSTSGTTELVGSMVMNYTRTWDEIDPVGISHQVYRFVVKIDFRDGTPGALHNSCLFPPCIGPEPSAFYYGYLDYAWTCGPVTFQEAALVLFHNCDEFIHHPTSAKRGIYHPDTSFALVAPSTPANPFVASIAAPPAGPMVAEAVRNTAPPGATCIFEDRLQNGAVQILGAGCGCAFAPNPPQLTARRISGTASCTNAAGINSSFLSANASPTFPWFHMMTTSIGSWTTPMGYPGEEAVWVDEVPIFYRDSCVNSAFGEVYYGASTAKGWTLGTTILTQNFTDLASNTSWSVPGAPPTTFMGCVLPTRNLIYFNLP